MYQRSSRNKLIPVVVDQNVVKHLENGVIHEETILLPQKWSRHNRTNFEPCIGGLQVLPCFDACFNDSENAFIGQNPGKLINFQTASNIDSSKVAIVQKNL